MQKVATNELSHVCVSKNILCVRAVKCLRYANGPITHTSHLVMLVSPRRGRVALDLTAWTPYIIDRFKMHRMLSFKSSAKLEKTPLFPCSSEKCVYTHFWDASKRGA